MSAEEIGYSPISTIIKGNKLSNTIYQQVVSYSDITDRSKAILDYEKDTLSLDRSNQSIGLPPSVLHAYELLSLASQFDEKQNSYALAGMQYMAGQVEMVISLYKPKNVLWMNLPAHGLPREYINQFNFENFYVVNDEQLFRDEHVIENSETPFTVLEEADILSGVFPSTIDLIIMDTVSFSSLFDLSALEKIYENLAVGGVILLYNNNDYITYYANNDEFEEEKPYHPIYDVNQQIKTLNNALVYHISTTAGITVIIKN